MVSSVGPETPESFVYPATLRVTRFALDASEIGCSRFW
jgi:hypothetical protein